MSIPYPEHLDLVQTGEPVSAPVTNRPTGELAQRTDSLREKVDHGLFGSSLIVWGAAVDNDALTMGPVYLGDDGVYHKALFQVASNADAYTLAPSSWCVGIVRQKLTGSSADLVTSGVAKFTRAQLQAVTDSGLAETGQLYLSSSHAGKLTATKPPYGVQVCYVAGPDLADKFTAIIAPLPRMTIFDHLHLLIPLTMGTSNGTTTAGWIPVSGNSSFFSSKGIIPPGGAISYYRHDLDTKLKDMWPIQPLQLIELRRNGVFLRLDGTSPDAVINSDGIWWMKSGNPPTTTGTVGAVSALALPGGEPDRIELLAVRSSGLTGIVTSLVAANSTVVITDPRGGPASVGALKIRAQFPLAPADTTPGYLALKGIDNDALTQKRGVVVEGIKLKSGGGLVFTDSSLAVTDVSPTGDTNQDTARAGYKGGLVELAMESPSGIFEGSLETVALDGVDPDQYGGVYVQVFRQGATASVRGSIRIGERGVPSGGMNLTIEVLGLAMANGTLPDMSLATRIVGQGTVGGKQTLLTTDTPQTAIALSAAGAMTAGQYTRAVSSPITVHAGDMVYLTLSRAASDGYAGDLGVIDLKYRLTLP